MAISASCRAGFTLAAASHVPLGDAVRLMTGSKDLRAALTPVLAPRVTARLLVRAAERNDVCAVRHALRRPGARDTVDLVGPDSGLNAFWVAWYNAICFPWDLDKGAPPDKDVELQTFGAALAIIHRLLNAGSTAYAEPINPSRCDNRPGKHYPQLGHIYGLTTGIVSHLCAMHHLADAQESSEEQSNVACVLERGFVRAAAVFNLLCTHVESTGDEELIRKLAVAAEIESISQGDTSYAKSKEPTHVRFFNEVMRPVMLRLCWQEKTSDDAFETEL